MARKKSTAQAVVRNLLHDHPLLRKGGVHAKTTKAKRRQAKLALRKGEPYTLNTLAMQCVAAMRFSPAISYGAPSVC